MKKLPAAAFFDVDGTLYDHKNNEIPALHMQALQELHDKGVKVCLCTGRAIPLVENLGILHSFEWDGIVAGNGAYVCDKEGTTLHEQFIAPEVAKQIFDNAEKEDVSLFVAGNTTFTTDLKPHTQKILRDFHVEGIDTRGLRDTDKLSIVCLVVDNPMEPRPSFENLPDIRTIHQTYAYDLIPDNLSKFRGIQVLLNHYGIDEHDYIAFGDSYNDVEMLENAKVGCVMADGDPRMLEKFETHCPSASVGGIYTFLHEEHYL